MMTRNISFIDRKVSIKPYIDLQSPDQILTSKKRYVQRWETSFCNHLAQLSDAKLHVTTHSEDDLQPYLRLLNSISSLTVWLPNTLPMIRIPSEKMLVVRYTPIREYENFIFIKSAGFSRGLVYWHNALDLIPEITHEKAFLGVLLSSQKATHDIIEMLDFVSLNKKI